MTFAVRYICSESTARFFFWLKPCASAGWPSNSSSAIGAFPLLRPRSGCRDRSNVPCQFVYLRCRNSNPPASGSEVSSTRNANFGASFVKARRTPLRLCGNAPPTRRAATRFRGHALTARYRRSYRRRQLSQSAACEFLNTNGVARSVKMTRFPHGKRALGTIKLSNSRKYAAAAIAWVA